MSAVDGPTWLIIWCTLLLVFAAVIIYQKCTEPTTPGTNLSSIDVEPGDVIVAIPSHLQEQQPYNDNSLSDKAWEVLRATVPETALKMYEEKALEKMHQDKITKAKEEQRLKSKKEIQKKIELDRKQKKREIEAKSTSGNIGRSDFIT